MLNAPEKVKSTFADYDAMPETNQIVELMDGEIVVTSPLDVHQAVLLAVFVSLQFAAEWGKFRMAPSGLYFDEHNSFEPDLFWVSHSNTRCTLQDDGRYWQGAPDLVIEILSPSTEARDRDTKFRVYERYGVSEYWLVNPTAQFVEVFRQDEGRLVKQGLYTAEQSFVSAALGGATIDPKNWFNQ
jgi:Uma2 family endonuclease